MFKNWKKIENVVTCNSFSLLQDGLQDSLFCQMLANKYMGTKILMKYQLLESEMVFNAVFEYFYC